MNLELKKIVDLFLIIGFLCLMTWLNDAARIDLANAQTYAAKAEVAWVKADRETIGIYPGSVLSWPKGTIYYPSFSAHDCHVEDSGPKFVRERGGYVFSQVGQNGKAATIQCWFSDFEAGEIVVREVIK